MIAKASTLSSIVAWLFFMQILLVHGQTGDFIFELPDPKKQDITVAIGSVMRLAWRVQPATLKSPPNLTIAYRYGAWPNVGPWVAIATDTENVGYYDWTVPDNVFPGRYIFQINSTQIKPLIRSRITQPVIIYRDKVFLTSDAPNERQTAAIAVQFLPLTATVMTSMLFIRRLLML